MSEKSSFRCGVFGSESNGTGRCRSSHFRDWSVNQIVRFVTWIIRSLLREYDLESGLSREGMSVLDLLSILLETGF